MAGGGASGASRRLASIAARIVSWMPAVVSAVPRSMGEGARADTGPVGDLPDRQAHDLATTAYPLADAVVGLEPAHAHHCPPAVAR